MKVSRSALIAQLESVRFGISPKNLVEQASCFVIDVGNRCFTFNDEVACWGPCVLTVDAAVVVPAAPLLGILPKLQDDDLDISVATKEGKPALVIRGKGKEFVVPVESECRMPINEVPTPKGWQPLHAEMVEGLPVVADCASTDDAMWVYSMIHMTERFIEASDNDQIARWRVKTPAFAGQDILIRAETAKSIIYIEPTEVSVGDKWVFFRQGKGGVMVGCRRYAEEQYRDFTAAIEQADGFHKASLPSGLGEAAEVAYVLSSENADSDDVTVKIKGNEAVVIGVGASGATYKEKRRVAYSGPFVQFSLNPKLLVKLTKDYTDCEVSARMIRVKAGRLTYTVSLEKE